jgi:hypothetical protein
MADITQTLNLIDQAFSGQEAVTAIGDAKQAIDRPRGRDRILFDKFSVGVAHGAKHLEPILVAVRDHGVEISFIHLDEDIRPVDGIAVLADDISQEPEISRYPSLKQHLTTCWSVYIIPEQPATLSYSRAAFDAVRLSQNVLIIETNLSHVPRWRDIVLSANPDLWLMIEMPETQGLPQ